MHAFHKTTLLPRIPITNAIIRRSFRSDPLFYAQLIQTYARDRALHHGKKLHAHLITNGIACFSLVASNLVSFYACCGQLSHARKLFDKIPKTNVRRWISFIGTCARCSFHHEAIAVFSEMLATQTPNPNAVFVIPSVLKACGHVGDQITGQKIHGLILKCCFEVDPFVSSSLIVMYSKCLRVGDARKVFDGMEVKDLVALNALVAGYSQVGLAGDAWSLVERMRLMGVNPNLVTWNSLLSGFSQKCDLAMVSEIFRLMTKDGVVPDVVSWTSVISGFVQNFRNEEAFDTFKQMLRHGFCPTSATISTLLPACATVERMRIGKEIHGYALAIGIEEDIYVRSALVDMYAKCGFISEARTLFGIMPEKNTVTWNSIIFGYANHGYCDEAIELFNQMEMEGKAKLDHLTFTAILTACVHAGDIELGQSLFKTMQEKYGIEPRLEHYACMVDLLGRAGKVDEAYCMIKAMPIEPDLFVWGALLAACRNHGHVELAEVAAKHLLEVEPESVGNRLLLTGVYADVGKWAKVERVKKRMKKGKQRKFQGLSWIERTGCVVSCSSSGNSYNISWEAPLDDPAKQIMLKVNEPLSLLTM
ncbi:pentatricopeptide repeat-containing protein At5g59600 isoform X1 [Arachis hypogaea]|uniref:pentatricopeptide repeat-containing protein At5g59600 isoform X1 n=1 Tax=Arachis hypogaea TaxID=3818 RepID=UPI000DEC9758|nr:pentatricopeptide repeat-containing protein At5g59600 [Arachis hypogaea]QHO55119.1 Pentatricopeptide repeat-containing protein [Arachis hypogaea]